MVKKIKFGFVSLVTIYFDIRLQVADGDTAHSIRDKNGDMNAIDNSYMSSIVMVHAEKTDILEKVIKDRNDMQFHLSSQVEILQQTLQELESDMNVNHREAHDRIGSLEKTKRAAEINLEKQRTARGWYRPN